MTTIFRSFTGAIALICVSTSSHAQVPLSVAVGCYRLTPGTWSAPIPAAFRVDTIAAVLDSILIAPGRERLPPFYQLGPTNEAIGVVSARPSPFAPRWYSRADSVFLSWSTGFHGIAVAARLSGDSLQGTMWYGSDHIVSNPPRAPVVGVRATCPR